MKRMPFFFLCALLLTLPSAAQTTLVPFKDFWKYLVTGTDPGTAYGIRFTLTFLDRVPDADRADRALTQIAPAVEALVIEDPAHAEESRTPLDLSPRPDGRSRRLFEPALIERHLDAVESEQQPDGGWDFSWPHWNPASALEWRGLVTLEALRLLHAHERL